MAVTLLSKKRNAGNILNLLQVREIQDSVLCLRPSRASNKQEKEYAAVIAVNPVNFSLMSEGEQEAILEGFRILLQRLQTKDLVSIHIRTRPYDIAPYLDRLKEAQRGATTEAMRAMALDHEQFVLSLASEHAILQREFYIRVSARPEKSRRRLLPEEVFERIQQVLTRKCDDILDDLARSSLSGHRLNDGELAQYYLSCVHSHYAEKYPLQEISLQALDLPIQPFKLTDLDPDPVEPDSLLLTEDKGTTALLPLDENAAPGADEANEKGESTPPLAAPALNAKETPKPKKTKGDLWGSRRRRRNAIAEPTPFSTLAELLQPAYLEQQPHYIKVYKETTEYYRARSVVSYPAYVFAGWLDRLIQIDEPYIDLVLYLETLDPHAFTQRLSRKMTAFRATQTVDQRGGRTENPYISAALSDVETLRDQIVAQTEQVHAISLYIGCRASSVEELRQRDEKIVSLLRALDLESVELTLEHLQAWLTMLPENRDLPKRRKILETSSVVTAFPFASTSLSTEPGSLVGVMPNGSLVIINPASQQLENGHEVVFARSGAGKSYSEKVRLTRNLLMGMEAIVIDPEDEYLALCNKVGGSNVRLSPGRLQLNPFDLALPDTKERNVLEEKVQSLLVLFDLLLADNASALTQKEKAFLTRCISKAYERKGITSDLSTHHNQPPNMADFYRTLTSGECGPDSYDLGDRLLRHLEHFPDRTQVELDNPLVVFNIRDLSDELKPVGLWLVTDFVWTQIRRERRPRPRQLIIDEAWVLMQFAEGGRFLASMARRARKYNLCLRVITQDVEDFLNSEYGRIILKNASCKWLMKQDASTIDAIAQAFRLSEGERRYLLGCQRGEGLYFCNLSHVPLRIIASPTEHKLATTNAQELLQEELAKQARIEQHVRKLREEAIGVETRRNEFDIVLPSFYTQGTNERG